MKLCNTISLFTYLLLIGSLFSCEEALEEEVIDFTSSEDFYNNEQDAVAAINAVYQPMQADVFGRWYQTMLDIRSDHAQHELPNPALIAIDEFSMDPTHPQNETVWSGLYRSINLSNVVIERVPQIDMDEDRRSQLIAEAHFLRGLAYFTLARMYGGVPIKTTATSNLQELSAPRATLDDVYTLIVDDFTTAQNDLPSQYESSEFGRPTASAATAMLAEVYIARGNFEQAKQLAQEVIDLGTYQLLESYENVFSISSEGHSEHLFVIKYNNVSGLGNGLPAWYNNGGSNNPYGNAAFAAIQGDDESDLWQRWDVDDPRRQYTLYETYVGKNGDTLSTRDGSRPFFAFGKWRDPVAFSGSVNHSNDFPIMRYAEVLLILAEAENEVNGPTALAYDAINQVRRRGYELPINEPSTVDLSGLSQEEFRTAVLDERSHELVSEAKRWFDLVRTGLAVPILSTKTQSQAITEDKLLFPIPQTEIDNNEELSEQDQNPGYR